MNEDVFHLGIKALIRNDKGEILLLQVNKSKLKNPNVPDYWDIPGGRIQKGHTTINTLKREIEEEIGVSEVNNINHIAMVLSSIRIPVNNNSYGLILSIYTCDIPKNSNITISDEHVSYCWFSSIEASKLLQFKYPVEFTNKIKYL